MSHQSNQRNRAHLGHYLSYCIYKFICIFMKMTDVRVVAILGRIAGYIVWACAGKRRRIVARNLRIVIDPTLREDQLSSMVRRNIVRTTMNLACSMKTGLMKEREFKRSIHVEGADIFERCGSNGHTVVSCIPHAGNWEALARIRPLFSRVPRFASMYRRLSNPLLEEFIYSSRTRYGCEMYSKEDGLREILKLAHGGGLLGILSDQFTAEGVYLPYFGKVTGVTPLPAIVYKRCKGKGHLFSVFTRNTSLGHWDTVMDREIHLPEGCESLPDITMQVNLALEKCQSEHIMDGFWMHHRWKTPQHKIAPEMDEDTQALVRRYARLPFRMLVVSPNHEQEAETLVPIVRTLATCRPDAQVTVICPSCQEMLWRRAEGVRHVVRTDTEISVRKQLQQDDIYKDGPFDVLFMFGGDRSLWRQLQHLFPLLTVGWEGHPLSRRFRVRYKRCNKQAESSSSPHTSEDYAVNLMASHQISI